MPKLSAFLKKHGEALGMTSEQLAKITGNDNVEISEEVANLFSSVKVFTEESAKANPEIRAAIRAEALNGVDALRQTLFSKYEFPDEVKASLMSETKTSNWIQSAFEKLADLERKKAETSGKGKTELEKEIQKLNEQILSNKNAWEAEKKDLTTARERDRVNWEMKSIYSGYDYALGEVDKQIAIDAASAVVERKLRERGIVINMTETGLQPFVNKDGQFTPYYDNNQKISASDLIKKELLAAKLLKVNDGNQRQANGNQQQFQQQGTAPQLKVAPELGSLLNEAAQRDGFSVS